MSGRTRSGVMLPEVLMMVGILGVFAVVMLPSLSSARERALATACKSNLRQLALAAVSYALETGYFPWGMVDPSMHDDAYMCREEFSIWPREQCCVHGIRSWSEYSTYCWDFRKKTSDRFWTTGPIFDRGSAAEVFCCPKCKLGTYDNWDGNQMTGYNYNVAFLGYVEGDRSNRLYPLAWDKITAPDKVVIFGDGGYAGGCNKFMRAPKADKEYDNSSASLRKAGTQAFRHGRGRDRHTNMAFVDCHVSAFYKPYQTAGKEGWVDEETHSAFIAPGNGIYGPWGWGKVEDDDE